MMSDESLHEYEQALTCWVLIVGGLLHEEPDAREPAFVWGDCDILFFFLQYTFSVYWYT